MFKGPILGILYFGSIDILWKSIGQTLTALLIMNVEFVAYFETMRIIPLCACFVIWPIILYYSVESLILFSTCLLKHGGRSRLIF